MHGKDLVGQGAPSPPTVSMTFRITLTQGQIGMNGRLFLPGGFTLIYYDRRDATLDHRGLAPQLSSECLVYSRRVGVKPDAWRNVK